MVPVKSGFDIGVGANCIYPTLALLKYGWEMTGSELNKQSKDWATEHIIQPNPKLYEKIKIRHQSDPNCVLEGVIRPEDMFDFTMCNPPFFLSMTERKERHSSVCPISDTEESTEGGEACFLERYC